MTGRPYREYIDITNTRFIVNGDLMCLALYARIMNPYDVEL